MKKVIIFFLLILSLHSYGQDVPIKRSAIFFENAGKFPQELETVRNWLINFTSQLPFQYRNGKVSQKNDAEFRQFSLSSRKAQRFAIGNSGCYFEMDSTGQQQNVQYEGKWRIAAYDPAFELNEFKPTDNEKIFTTSLLVYNISEEQAMAHFINHYITGKEPLTEFIAAVERWSGKQLELKNDNNLRLKTVSQAIYSKTNESASTVCYKIYLKDKDPKKERDNLYRFLSTVASSGALSNFFDVITPEGKFYFKDAGVSLSLPGNLFLYVDDQNKPLPAKQVSFKTSFDFASYKILYDEAGKPYFNLKFEKLHFANQFPAFQIVDEYKLNKSHFQIIPFKQRQTFKTSAIKEIQLQLYEGFLKASIVIDNGHDSFNPEYMVLEKKIQYK